MSHQPPSQSEWAMLYQAAVAFKAAAPWEWMYDSDLFGVQNPADGEIGYCCIMGNLGEHFALGLYRGTAGLAGYLAIQSGEFGDEPDPLAILATQTCLMASFEDRAYLEKPDLAVIKSLGLKFRGRNAWPQFRDHQPTYFPWYLSAEQARFLTLALEQSVDVALRFQANPDLLEPPHEGQYLVRVPEQHAAGLAWHDAWMAPAAFTGRAIEIPQVDQPRLRQLKQTLRAGPSVWEADLFLSPTPIQEGKDQRPFYPYMSLWVDQRSGMVLPPHLAGTSTYLAEFQTHVLSLIEQSGALPKEIHVLFPELVALLEPITKPLGIKLRRAKELPMLEEARTSLLQYFDRF
ncbi:MAG: hypothetical protein U0Z44_09310 [Kouleothrix sp.]